MALQRVDSSTTIQPSGGFPVAQFGMDKMMEAQSWKQLGDTFQTGYDLVKKDFDADAVQRAQTDAPALIKRDGKGAVLPVSSFEPEGITSKAYRDAYKSAAYNLYSASVEQDFQGHAQNVITQYPTDIEAARKALTEKRQAVVSGLDPQYAPLIALRLNAMSGQVESRINANVQAETNQRSEKDALWAYDNVVSKASQLAQIPDRFDPEFLKQNHQLLATEMERAVGLMKMAGWSDAKIAGYIKDAKVNTAIARDENVMRSTVLQSQNYSSEEMTAWQQGLRDQIEATRKKLGPDGPAYIAKISSAFAWAMQSTQLAAQKREAVVNTAQQRDALGLLGMARNGTEGVAPADVLRATELRRNAIYNDPSLSEAQKIRGIALYDQAMGSVKSDIDTYATGRVTGLVTQMTDPTVSPAASRGALQELRQFVSDPVTTASVSPAIRNYAERSISTVAANAEKSDFATYQGLSLGGYVQPEHVRQRLQTMADKGQIGDAPNALMRPDAAAQFMVQADQAYQQRQLVSATARQGVSGAAKGTVPSTTEQAAMAQLPELAFKNGGEAYDKTNPEHRLNAAAHLNGTMLIPEQVKSQLQAVQMGGDPAQAVAAAAQSAEFKRVLMNKPGFNEERSIGFLRSQLGEGIADYLSLVQRFDPERANNLMAARSNSESRGLGTNPNQAADGLSASFDAVMGKIADPSIPVTDRLNPFSPLTGQQEWTRTMLGDKAPSLGAELWNDIGVFRQKKNPAQFQTIGATQEIKDEALAAAMAIKGRGGDLNKAYPQVSDPNQIAIMQAMEGLRDKIELVADPKDDTRGTWQWKSANTKLGEIAKQPGGLSDQQVRGFGIGLYEKQLESEKAAGDNIARPDVRRDTITMVPTRSSDGSFSWAIRGEYKTGVGSTTLMTLPDGDPRLSAFAGDVINQAAKDLREHWLGLTPQPTGVDQGWWAGRVLGYLMSGIDQGGKALFSDYKRQQYKGAIFDRLGGDADPRSYIKRMVDVVAGNPADSSQWPTKAIDWKQTAAAMEASKSTDLEQRARDAIYWSRIKAATPALK